VEVQHLVDEAEVLVVEVRPHEQRDEAGDGVGQQEEGAVELLTLDAIVVEGQGQEETEAEGEQHRSQGEDDGPCEGLEELGAQVALSEEPGVVGQSHVLLPGLGQALALGVDEVLGQSHLLDRVDVPGNGVGDGVGGLVVDHPFGSLEGGPDALDLDRGLVCEGNRHEASL